MKINQSIIRIIGLLGEEEDKNGAFVKGLIQNGYQEEPYPLKDGAEDKGLIYTLRDQYYTDFRNIMYLQDKEKSTTRLFNKNEKFVKLAYKSGGKIVCYCSIKILKCEIFLFKDQIGLFSLSLQPTETSYDINQLSNILSIVRLFDTALEDGTKWHEWISVNYLSGKPLRGPEVMVDEYSGSKFKLFTVVDADMSGQDRKTLLFDLATTSPLGSGSGQGNFAPDPEYYQNLLSNRISVFHNYEALCLFDGFCCVGTNQLENFGSYKYSTWDYTYFRIYLFRIFFKYNLYRYNSAINHKKNDTIQYRNQFEAFLIKYNISHISFNFLGNEIFHKTGKALDLDTELTIFRERINSISAALQEKRQAKTNFLLQGVTVLSFIASLSPILDLLKVFDKWLGFDDSVFNAAITFLIIIVMISGLYYLINEKLLKWISKRFGTQ